MDQENEVIALPEASSPKREVNNLGMAIPGINAVAEPAKFGQEALKFGQEALNGNLEIAKDEIGVHGKIAKAIEDINNLDIPEEQKDKRIDDLMKVGERVHKGAEGGRRTILQITFSILKWTVLIVLSPIIIFGIIVVLFMCLVFRIAQSQGPEASKEFGEGLAKNMNNLIGRNNKTG
jgi:hypothetical protein